MSCEKVLSLGSVATAVTPIWQPVTYIWGARGKLVIGLGFGQMNTSLTPMSSDLIPHGPHPIGLYNTDEI